MGNFFVLELTSENVPYQWFELELDTHAPVVTFGTPTGAAAGDVFSVSYTINEPAIVQATLIDSGGTHIPLTISPTNLSVTLPSGLYGGMAQVVVIASDDVSNTAVYTLPVQLVGLVPVEQEIGGGRPYTFGPAYKRQEFVFDVAVAAQRRETFEFDATVSAHDNRQRFEFPITAAALRRQEFEFSGHRSADLRLAQMLREDEELLLML